MLNFTPKRLPFLLFATLYLGLLAFKSSSPATQVKTGTYSYTSDADAQLLLQLNNDNTFRYVNNTNPAQPIDLSGRWSLTGRVIVLSEYDEKVNIANSWKIDEKYDCLKSRHGLLWTRLCLQ
jgi:hypothetical protein